MELNEKRRILREAHDSVGHKRKYTGQPYWVHTEEVADIVSQVTYDEDIIAAAAAHDILEDISPQSKIYTPEFLKNLIGERAYGFVVDLTDVYIKENYPDLNRAQRKKLERERVGKIRDESKTIKLADLISNSKDIVVNDPGFAITYLREKEDMMPYLAEGDPTLFHEAMRILAEGKEKLGL